MKKYKTGIFILRAQPDHLAHLDTIRIMSEKCERIIISIGSHNRPRTIKNPFTSDERIDMVMRSMLCEDISADKVEFQAIRDYMYNDYKWAAEVYSKALINGATQDKQTCLFGHFKDDSSYYLNMFPQWDLHTVTSLHNGISATDIRNNLFAEQYLDKRYTKLITESTHKKLVDFIFSKKGEKLREEYSFIKEYKNIWSVAPFPPTFVTSDAVVIKAGHVLLIKRGGNPGKGLLALPGGFLNINEQAVSGALRELKEETRIDVPMAALKNHVAESEVFDHPLRSLRGRTITHAFLINLGPSGSLPKIKAGDDAVGARWVPLGDAYAMEDQMFEDHYDIIIKMTSKY